MICKSCKTEPQSEDLLNKEGVCVLCEPEPFCDLCGDTAITKVLNGEDYNPESFIEKDGLTFCKDCL